MNIVEEVSMRRRLTTLRHLAQMDLVERVSLTTSERLILRSEEARSLSNGIPETIHVYYVDGDYWCGTVDQLNAELAWGSSPEIVFSYSHGRLVTEQRYSNVGILGGGG